MACIQVTEPLRVCTKNSVFRVECLKRGEAVVYKATKVEAVEPSNNVSVDQSVIGKEVYLELGHRMILGGLHTSTVIAVEYIEPHH